MERRREALQSFVDAAAAAFGAFARDRASQRSIADVFAALKTPRAQGSHTARRLPACVHLDRAVSAAMPHPSLAFLIETFRALEPSLAWRQRSSDETASANFEEGHANAMILGPGGCEERRDVWLGVTLMAPNVRYPDHDHAPEEVYLVLSDGEFKQGDGDWFAPGVGGSFHNVPGIRHAMRSLGTPLFAFWALRVDAPVEASRSSPIMDWTALP